MQSETQVTTSVVKTNTLASSRVAIAFVSALLGASLVYVAGFANAQVLHNAAHDSRHSTGFPCH